MRYDYRDEVDAAHAATIWTHHGMTNWYRNRDQEGRQHPALADRGLPARLHAAGLEDFEGRAH